VNVGHCISRRSRNRRGYSRIEVRLPNILGDAHVDRSPRSGTDGQMPGVFEVEIGMIKIGLVAVITMPARPRVASRLQISRAAGAGAEAVLVLDWRSDTEGGLRNQWEDEKKKRGTSPCEMAANSQVRM